MVAAMANAPPPRRRLRRSALAVAATLACAVFLWLRGGELASSVMPQQQRRLQAAHPPAGACARAVPAAAAAAVARAVAAGAAPLEEVEAKVVEEQCSAAFRAEAAEDGKKGNGPRAFKWACPSIDTCDGHFVSRQVAYMRATPRYRSLLEMTPCDLWRSFRGRTLWLVGDSQAQRYHKTLSCLTRPFWLPKEYWPEKEWRPEGQRLSSDTACSKEIHGAILQHNTCCGVEHPICTRLLGGTMVCHLRINFGPHLLTALQSLHVLGASRGDIVEFNFGLWHHKREGNYEAFARALAEHYAANKSSLPHLIWRDNSPQHFDLPNGEFPHPDEAGKLLYDKGKGGRCVPMKDVELLPDGTIGGSNEHVATGGWRNQLTNPIFQAVGMPIHYTWNNTVDMYDGHKAGECTHWCSPGAHGVWAWSLWRTLLAQGLASEQ